MPIYFKEKSQTFHLQNQSVSYIFKILRNGQLGHLYFGKRLTDREHFDQLFTSYPRPATAYVYEGEETFSLDLIPQEFPAFGTTDFREPAMHVYQEDGSRVTQFTYETHHIEKGKPMIPGLPATYTEGPEEATTLTVHLTDEHLDGRLKLSYTLYEGRPVITRHASISNLGRSVLSLQRFLSASVDFIDSEFDMVQLSGAWSRERHVVNRPLMSGIQKITSTRGTSSAQQNPFLALKRPWTTEHEGEVYGFSFVYSGNFHAQVEVDHYQSARISIGLQPFDFSWRLESGESFHTPEVVMVFSDNGLNGMSQSYHELYRNRLARGTWRDRSRPTVINNWEATYFQFDEKKLLDVAKEASDLGIEMFVLDDGWFGKRNNDKTSLGDWFVNDKKLPNGLDGLSKKLKSLGLLFGLWFEPEMISKESQLFKSHPEWLIQVPDRHLSHGRFQYVLDFSRTEVIDYIYEKMAKILSESNVDYVKWDMNRNLTEIGSLSLPPNRQQELPHRYILGVYELYERLINAFPTILFESCASGGARFDPGMLYYAPQAWASDDTDAVERLKIQYGSSYVYPLSSIGAHVSAVPNHQTGRITSLEMRAAAAYYGVFGYELDLTALTQKEKEAVKQQLIYYKKYRELFQKGTFYRLYSPFQGDRNGTGWMVVDEKKNNAIVSYYQTLSIPNPPVFKVKLTGIDPEKSYFIQELGFEAYGDELMYAGIQLPDKRHKGDFQSYTWTLTSRE